MTRWLRRCSSFWGRTTRAEAWTASPQGGKTRPTDDGPTRTTAIHGGRALQHAGALQRRLRLYQQWDEGDYEDEEYEDLEEPYTDNTYGANDYEDTEFPDGGLGDDGILEEAYAAYLDARRHFAQLKAARGYFPVVALADSGSSMAASSQSPKPPKGRGKGRGKIKGKPSYRQSNPPQKGSAASRANAT